MPGAAEVTANVRERIVVDWRPRGRTTALLAPFSDEELARQVSPLMSPLVWDLAHIGHFEELWISGGSGAPADLPRRDDTTTRSRTSGKSAPLELLDPAAAALPGRRRARSLAVLEETRSTPRTRCSAGLRLRPRHSARAAAPRDDAPDDPALRCPARRWTAAGVAGGLGAAVWRRVFIMGTNDEPWAYDNERPAHEAETGAFGIDLEPVSNAEYAAFLDDGGWDQPPLSWERDGVPGAPLLRAHGAVPPRSRCSTSPGTRPTHRAVGGQAAADRGRVGASGRARPAARDRRVWEWTASTSTATRAFASFPYARVLRGVLRRRVQGAARRLLGDASQRRPAPRSATGTTPSAGRSSPASAAPATPMSDRATAASPPVDVHLAPPTASTRPARRRRHAGLTSTPK